MSSPIDDHYSLMRGGPTYRLVRSLVRLVPSAMPERLVTCVVLLLTIVPVAVVAGRAGRLWPGSTEIPLLGDWFVLARFVVALPLLMLATRISDGMVGAAIRQFSHSGIVAAGSRQQFEQTLASAYRAREVFWPELLCLLLALAPVLLSFFLGREAEILLPGHASWRYESDGTITTAGVWLELVAAPVFRFVMLLWLWRLLLWSWLLWRFTRLDLVLHATHPDRAGGLAFLGLAQSRFATLSAAGAIVICGSCANQMLYADARLPEFQYLIAAYVFISTGVLLAPLLLMAPLLARLRRQELAKHDAVGHRLVQAFDARWKTDGSTADPAEMLDSPSPSALTDFSSVYANILATNIVPVNRWNLATMALAAALPFVPLAFIAMSFAELMGRMVSALL